MTTMRAKMRVASITPYRDSKGEVTQETLKFNAVSKSGGYPSDGGDDDNTYARWSPSGELTLTVANPSLFGKFYINDKFYLDFTPADDA